MTLPPPPAQPHRKADVYVLEDHVNGRDVKLLPIKRADKRDLTEIYALDRLVNYPDIQHRFQVRMVAEAKRIRANRAWAKDAVDAIYHGVPVPGDPRERCEQVLRLLVERGPRGATRPEICRRYGIDGGMVSAAMTYLHECGAIFPLDGVKR